MSYFNIKEKSAFWADLADNYERAQERVARMAKESPFPRPNAMQNYVNALKEKVNALK